MAQIMGRNAAENAEELTTQGTALREEYTELVKTDPEKAAGLWDKASELLLQATNWKAVWMAPAIMAGIILVLFVVLFHDKVKTDEEKSESN